MSITTRRAFFSMALSLLLQMQVSIADPQSPKCMKRNAYGDDLELVRVQSTTYQDMTADGEVDKRYYEDTYVILNVGSEPLCNVDFMLVLPTDGKNDKTTILPQGATSKASVNMLPPGATTKTTAGKKSEGGMKVYATEGMNMEINPDALYPKVTGRGRNGKRGLKEEKDSTITETETDMVSISGNLPDLYIAPDDANMFGFTLSSMDKDAPMMLPELCIVSYQSCNTETMSDEQKEQMVLDERMMHEADADIETKSSGVKRPKKEPHPMKMYGPGGSHANRKLEEEPRNPHGPGGDHANRKRQLKTTVRPRYHESWYVGLITPGPEMEPSSSSIPNPNQDKIKYGVHPIPVNHGGKNKGKKKMTTTTDGRYPVPSHSKVFDADVVNWSPVKAGRFQNEAFKFDVAIVQTNQKYLALPREEEEDTESEDYLAIPRGEEEEETESEDYLTLPREEEQNEDANEMEDRETEDRELGPGGVHANGSAEENDAENMDSETEDYLALPRGEEEEENEMDTESEEYTHPRGELGPGGEHANRKRRFLRS
jgi:hypothetical protein